MNQRPNQNVLGIAKGKVLTLSKAFCAFGDAFMVLKWSLRLTGVGGLRLIKLVWS